MTNAYLEHHGILGMKWGVRRYRNYDGSYTKAGLARYDKSMGKYEEANARYKNAKAAYKTSKRSGAGNDGTKTELTNARMARKNAKAQLEKDYKHLRQDKLGDQGKELYSRGKTITGEKKTEQLLGTIGGLSVAAAYQMYEGTLGFGDRKTATIIGAIGAGTTVASLAVSARNEVDARKLRAYYSHTSNY